MFPKEPPSKEMIEHLMKNPSNLGPLPRCQHGIIAAICSACYFTKGAE